MDLSFYKLRICDADLILVDDLAGDGADRDWAKAARALLDRRRGAGADRMAVVSRVESATWLRVFGRGGEGGPYADAALCAARFLLDSGRSGSDSVELRVSGGELAVDVLDSASLGLALGPPRRIGSGEPVSRTEAAALETIIEAGGARYQVLPLRAGLPGSDGAAVFAEGAGPRARVRALSGARGGAAGTSSVGVAVRVVSGGELAVSARPGPSLDALSAAALALAAASATGRSEAEAMVRLRSGALWVEWTPRGAIYAVGRPEYVYRGDFHLAF